MDPRLVVLGHVAPFVFERLLARLGTPLDALQTRREIES